MENRVTCVSMKTLVGILNWNKPLLTIECYESIKKMRGNFIVLIIDNGSDKEKLIDLIQYARTNSFKIIYEYEFKTNELRFISNQDYLLILKKNYGYSKGNNFGLKVAKEIGASYYLLSNNDIIVEDRNTLNELIKIARINDTIAVVGPKIVYLDGSIQKPIKRKGLYELGIRNLLFPFVYPIEKFIERKKTSSKEDLEYPYYVSGAFMLLDVEKLFDVGLFDENVFLYAEESILAEKLKQKGYKFAYYPKIKVIHYHGQPTRILGSYKIFLHRLKSNLYYLKTYKSYDFIRLGIVILGQIASFFVWNPLRRFIRKLIKHIRRW